MINQTVDKLKSIFEKHKNERICVLGTMCCGKTTLIKQLTGYNCIDMDDEFWPRASEAEYEYYSQRPFTGEMNRSLYKLFQQRISAKPGSPLFGIYILDCDIVVYLDISEQLLRAHCEKRGDTNLSDTYNLKKWIELECSKYKAKNEQGFYYLTIME